MDIAPAGAALLWVSVGLQGLVLVTAAGRRERAASRFQGLTVLAAWAAVLVLVSALIGGDFSIGYVAETTSRATPLPYRVSALWGAMEGSLLFYAALTATFSWLVVRRPRPGSTRRLQLVSGAVAAVYLLLTAAMYSPFRTLSIPAVDGRGLLAILQHPAMVYHPPILYLGLTGLIAPMAITVAGAGSHDHAWLMETRKWLLVSWSLLIAGMLAGANWAYVELGWGGFWAWDPVENTSLMPWLAATAFIHTARIQERDGRLARWNAALAVAPFLLTILGVYLTRSGATGSIHAFAESPAIGRILLGGFALSSLAAAALVVRQRPGPNWGRLSLPTRDTWMVAASILLVGSLVMVLIGSAYPAYLQVWRGDRALVAPRYFILALAPVGLLLAALTPLAFRTVWANGRFPQTRLFLLALAGLAGALLAPNPAGGAILGVAAVGAATLLADTAARRPRRRLLAAHLAHAGFLLLLVGAAGSSLGSEFRGAVAPGDTVQVGAYTLTVERIVTGEQDRYVYLGADISIRRSGVLLDVVQPQVRAYEEQGLPVPEPSLRSTLADDLVVALSRVGSDAQVVELNVFLRPLVVWVWAGCLLLAASGTLALLAGRSTSSRQHRPATTGRPAGSSTSRV